MSQRGENRDSSEPLSPRELAGGLAGKSIPQQVVFLALWPFLEQLLGYCVGMTDLLIAGRMGSDTEAVLEALAVGAYMSWLLFIIQGAASTGVTALVSRRTGAGDAALADRATGQGAMLSFVLGGVAGLFIIFAAGFIVDGLFALEGAAREAAVTYLQIVGLSGPLSGLVFALNAGQRGAGETRTPFVIMLVVNAVNIALSWLLVLGPQGNHGVAGLAWGTVIGWIVGAVLAVVILLRRRGEPQLGRVRLRGQDMRPERALAWRILRVGIPSAIEVGFVFSIHVAIARAITNLSVEGALGAHIVTIRIESLSFLPGFAIGIAASTLAGQYLGLGDVARAKKAVSFCWLWAVIFMTAIGASLVAFPHAWVSWVAPGSALTVALAAPIIVLAGYQQPFLATAIILKTAMRGVGATRQVMVRTIGSLSFWRVAVLWAVVLTRPYDLELLWAIMLIEIICQSALMIRYFLRGRWAEQEV